MARGLRNDVRFSQNVYRQRIGEGKMDWSFEEYAYGPNCQVQTSKYGYGLRMISFGPEGRSNFTPRSRFCFTVAGTSRSAIRILRVGVPVAT